MSVIPFLFHSLFSLLGWRDCSLQLDQNVQRSTNTSCNVTSYDCSQITCSLPFSHEVIKLSVDIDQWQNPMTADVTVSVPVLEYDWSATFTDGEKIEIPWFRLQIEGFAIEERHVYLQCSLKKENGTVNFKVSCLFSRNFCRNFSSFLSFIHTSLKEAFKSVAESKNYLLFNFETFTSAATFCHNKQPLYGRAEQL